VALEPLDSAIEAEAAPEAVPSTSWGSGRDLRTWSAPAAAGLPWTQRAAELRTLTGRGRPGDRALRELMALQSSDWAFLVAAGTAGPYPRERAEGHLAALEEALADPSMEPALRHLAPWV
jgi:1,4-alpha-glucan branching enzyme